MAFDPAGFDGAALDVPLVSVQAVGFRSGGCLVTVARNPLTNDIVSVTWTNPQTASGQLRLRASAMPDVVQDISSAAGTVNVSAGYPWTDTAPTSLNVSIAY